MKLVWVEPRRGLDHEWIWPLALAAALVLARLEPRLGPGLGLVCPLKALTSIPCPTCGTTRALRALGELDIARALALNPLASLGAVALAGFSLYAVPALLLGTRRLRLVGLTAGERVAAVSVVLANWVWLVLDGR